MSKLFKDALDFADPHDPHQNEFELEDDDPGTGANTPFFEVRFKRVKGIMTLSEFPDMSDQIISDYNMRRLRGENPVLQTFIDLDNAPDYTALVKNSIKNRIESENEFNDNSLIEQISQKVGEL